MSPHLTPTPAKVLETIKRAAKPRSEPELPGLEVSEPPLLLVTLVTRWLEMRMKRNSYRPL